MNRFIYDQCYMKQQAERSAAPLDWIMQGTFRNEHGQPCRDDSPLGGRAIPHQPFHELVDIESDLLGIKLTGGKCNTKNTQYVPKVNCLPSGSCPPGAHLKNPGVRPEVQKVCKAAPIYSSPILRPLKRRVRSGPQAAPSMNNRIY